MTQSNDLNNHTDSVLVGGKGNDRLVGGDDADVILGKGGDDELEGGDGPDVLRGGKGSDVIDGGKGHDYLHGGKDDDVLIGDTGNDVIFGGQGDDAIEGGPGTDILSGGRGADLFVFAKLVDMGVGQKRDIITDFNGAEGDRVDLRGLAQSSGLESLTYIGSEAFTDKGQIRFENEILSGSIHGPQVDFEIQLVGVKTFTADDLLL